MRQWATGGERTIALRPRTENNARGRGKGRGRQSDQAAHPPSQALTGGQDDLLMQTARLALSTARQTRLLSAIVSRTLTVPDTSRIATALTTIARQEQRQGDDLMAYLWGLLILAIIDLSPDGLPQESLQPIRLHAEQCTTLASVRDSVLECQTYRTWSGDSNNIRLVVTVDLQEICMCVIRVLVSLGARMRYGPAPRGPLERAVSSSLQTRQQFIPQ